MPAPENVTRSLQIAGLTERPQTAPRQQRRARQRAAETPVERDARLRKERLKRAQERSEVTPNAREARLAEERLKRARKRAEETPAARAERLEKDRARRARARAGCDQAARAALLEERRTGDGARRSGQRVEAGVVVSDAVQELGARALSCINLSAEEIAFMDSSQQYTSDPRLALTYYYCCSVDPAGFVFGDEQLDGDEGSVPRERLKGVFDDYPKPDDLSACQDLASEGESESTDIWACATCGRVLLQTKNGDKVVFCALREMQRFVLDDAERVRLFAGCSEACVRKYRQVYFAGNEVYYLIPELVRDTESIPLCETCRRDPRKSAFSVASGHDYGRVGELPELTQIALDCIAPVRCFGMGISLTAKHSSGHTICFPSDGPSKVASILPRVESGTPAYTFLDNSKHFLDNSKHNVTRANTLGRF